MQRRPKYGEVRGAVKLVHAADLHLDSPLVGLSRYPGAPVEEVRGATRAAMENLVTLCIEEQAKLLVLSGDVFDGEWKDFSTGLFYCAQLARLKESGTAVVSIRGNHDAASSITPNLRLPDHVRELPSRRPETVLFEDLGVAVHGQSFPRRDVREDLTRAYPEPVVGAFNVGLLHTALTGSADHEPYAPCKLSGLQSKGYDYWALGHVHSFSVVAEDPWVVYPGNLQGRHAREAGPKGAVVVEVDSGRISSVCHRPLDVVRWSLCDVDVAGVETVDEALDRVRRALELAVESAEGRLVAARVALTGSSPLHRRGVAERDRWEADVRATAIDVGEGRLWIERVDWRTTPEVRWDDLSLQSGALGQVVRSFEELRRDPERRAELVGSLAELVDKLPPELRQGTAGLGFGDGGDLDAVLDDVRDVVLAALLDVSEVA